MQPSRISAISAWRLKNYAHFTSPIRRYADLIVHRALISAHGWGEDGLTPQDVERLESTAQHISDTERRSMMAERDTNDRYLAAFLSERVGEEFSGRISGIAKFGAFVRLDETGADGLIPMRMLGREYWRFDRDAATLTGEDSGRVIGLGARVTVKLAEAAPVTGGLALELISLRARRRRGIGEARWQEPAAQAGAGQGQGGQAQAQGRAAAVSAEAPDQVRGGC